MNKFDPIEAVAAPFPEFNIDTDQVIPARYLSRPRHDGIAECLFHDLRFDADGQEKPEFVLNRDGYRSARIIVAGRNFGCGSSRENAVWALYDYGIRAVIAPSTGDIFYNNSIKNGLLPIFLPEDVCNGLIAEVTETPGAKIAVDLSLQTVRGPDGIEHSFDIDPFAKECLLKGLDEIGYTLSLVDEISAFENRYGRENL
jgi:3-isopropylmalate/(R)-2-methylmalate dehydratase small subunit